MVDQVTDSMLVQLEAEVLEHRIAKSAYQFEVPVPKNAWNHFLHDHQHNGLLKRYLKHRPIKYTRRTATLELSKSHRFPESTYNYPHHLGQFVIAETATMHHPAEADIGTCGCPERSTYSYGTSQC